LEETAIFRFWVATGNVRCSFNYWNVRSGLPRTRYYDWGATSKNRLKIEIFEGLGRLALNFR